MDAAWDARRDACSERLSNVLRSMRKIAGRADGPGEGGEVDGVHASGLCYVHRANVTGT